MEESHDQSNQNDQDNFNESQKAHQGEDQGSNGANHPEIIITQNSQTEANETARASEQTNNPSPNPITNLLNPPQSDQDSIDILNQKNPENPSPEFKHSQKPNPKIPTSPTLKATTSTRLNYTKMSSNHPVNLETRKIFKTPQSKRICIQSDCERLKNTPLKPCIDYNHQYKHLAFLIQVSSTLLDFDHQRNHHNYKNIFITLKNILNYIRGNETDLSKIKVSIVIWTFCSLDPFLESVQLTKLDDSKLLARLEIFIKRAINYHVILPYNYENRNKKFSKLKRVFNEFYHEYLMPKSGLEKLIIVLDSSLEPIVAKETRFLVKLIDDFSKFKMFQVNFSGYRFDFKSEIAEVMIKVENMDMLRWVNGSYFIDREGSDMSKIGLNWDYSRLTRTDFDLDLSIFDSKKYKSYTLNGVNSDMVRKLRLSQGWKALRNNESVYIYNKQDDFVIYYISRHYSSGKYEANLKNLSPDAQNEAIGNQIIDKETKNLDLLIFNFFHQLNVLYPDRKAIFGFVRENEKIFSYFDEDIAHDQKSSK